MGPAAQQPAGPLPAPDYSAPAGAPYTAEEVTVQTAEGHTLAGTLTLPKSASASHRVAAIKDADQIAVIDQGKIVARGTHEELLGTSPLYRELAASQLLV